MPTALTIASVRQAMRDYERDYPNNDYDDWQNNKRYECAVLDDVQKKYPVKLIVCLASGQPLSEASGFYTATAVTALQRLGFRVVEK
jgi:hypothetical protein